LDGIFWLGLLIHLLNYLIFILILKRLKLDPRWALLYLFFPAFQWESRTLYPELSLLTLFLASFWVWLSPGKRSAFVSGLLMGVGLFIRTDAFLGILALSVQSFLRARERLIPFVVGAAIPAIGLVLINLSAFGNILPQITGTTSLVGQNLGLQYPVELLTFLGLLFIVLPFSLLSLRKKNEYRPFFIALVLLTCLFFVRFFSFWALPFSIPLLFTARLRYFIPILGILMIPTIVMYTEWLGQIKEWVRMHVRSESSFKLTQNAVFALLLVGLGLGTIYIHATHDSFLDQRRATSDLIHATIPDGSLVIGSADDCTYFLPEFFGPKDYQKVTTVEPGPLSSNTFVMDISYSTQRNNNGIRQEVIDAERQKIKDFIALHPDELEIAAQSREDVWITIWKVKV
jgi:hypothetical protein